LMKDVVQMGKCEVIKRAIASDKKTKNKY